MTLNSDAASPNLVKESHLAQWELVVARNRAERTKALEAASTLSIGKAVPSLPSTSISNVRNWPIDSGELNARQLAITECIPSEILRRLATSQWTAEEVLLAFVARAVIAQHLTNPLSDIFLDDGLHRARELDDIMSKTGIPIGPLHGLPISLKDVMNLKGHATTLGFVARADQMLEDSDELVKKLADAGAVFYCKTNVPQTLMSGECVNFLYGRTATPDNLGLSAGGSSGGEGSLVSLGGSAIGIGTDIGGSIRTPANFNGVYGLCPSQGRLPLHPAKYTTPTYLINGVAGPISRSIDGLEVYTRAVLSLQPWLWDFSCNNMPWNQSVYNETRAEGAARKLSFGFIANDGIVRPHPPIERGMAEVKEALRHQGFETLDIDFFSGKERLEEIALKTYGCTGGKATHELLARLDEPLIKEVVLSSPEDALTASELLNVGKEIYGLRQHFLEKWFNTRHLTANGRPVDVFILPSGGHVAPPHGTMEYLLYEAISNILDWTCATVPVGRVDPVLDSRPGTDIPFVPMSEYDRRNWERYTPEAYKDGAICLQVLGQRQTEEKVLACMRVIDAALGRPEGYMA